MQAEKYFLSRFFHDGPFSAGSKLRKLSLFMSFLVVQATKVNCPGSSADGNVLAFNNNTKTCDWASNVPGCGAERY